LSTKRGLFIVFEGPDGGGKSYQLERVAKWLRGLGQDVVVTREPGGTDWGEGCRALLLGERRTNPLSELFLFASSRAAHVDEIIRPNIAQGRIVLCDRFSPSTVVYQGYGTGKVSIEDIITVDQVTCQGLKPDLCLVLWVDGTVSRTRTNKRVADGGEDNTFDYRPVAEDYQRFVAENPLQYPRVIVVDAKGRKKAVFRMVQTEIEKILPQRVGERG
jgi:dTMP kinase